MRISIRTLCGVLLLGVSVLLIAVLVTGNLPSPRLYEARYEVRVRDYQKNIDQPEAVLNGLELVDSYALCDYLAQKHASVSVRCDKTRKITLVAYHAQADSAEHIVQSVYQHLCDTVTAYGDSMCLKKAAEYQRQIDSLAGTSANDGHLALAEQFRDRLAILQADAAGGMKYIEVLNPAEAGKAFLTPSRWMIILCAFGAALGMGFVLVFIKKAASR